MWSKLSLEHTRSNDAPPSIPTSTSHHTAPNVPVVVMAVVVVVAGVLVVLAKEEKNKADAQLPFCITIDTLHGFKYFTTVSQLLVAAQELHL